MFVLSIEAVMLVFLESKHYPIQTGGWSARLERCRPRAVVDHWVATA
jgi:hypothetical protein